MLPREAREDALESGRVALPSCNVFAAKLTFHKTIYTSSKYGCARRRAAICGACLRGAHLDCA